MTLAPRANDSGNIAANRVYQSTYDGSRCSATLCHARQPGYAETSQLHRCRTTFPQPPRRKGPICQPGPSVDGRYGITCRFPVICCAAASTAQKKAQPRRVALKFHQRRRFWRMCADVCKDTQHSSYFATAKPPVKLFLLLRNINFIVGRIRITKLKRAHPDRP